MVDEGERNPGSVLAPDAKAARLEALKKAKSLRDAHKAGLAPKKPQPLPQGSNAPASPMKVHVTWKEFDLLVDPRSAFTWDRDEARLRQVFTPAVVAEILAAPTMPSLVPHTFLPARRVEP